MKKNILILLCLFGAWHGAKAKGYGIIERYKKLPYNTYCLIDDRDYREPTDDDMRAKMRRPMQPHCYGIPDTSQWTPAPYPYNPGDTMYFPLPFTIKK